MAVQPEPFDHRRVFVCSLVAAAMLALAALAYALGIGTGSEPSGPVWPTTLLLAAGAVGCCVVAVRARRGGAGARERGATAARRDPLTVCALALAANGPQLIVIGVILLARPGSESGGAIAVVLGIAALLLGLCGWRWARGRAQRRAASI